MQGVSFNPCSDIYCGTEGGSELETIALQDEALRLQVSSQHCLIRPKIREIVQLIQGVTN